MLIKMEKEKSQPIVKKYKPCEVCKDTITGIPTGMIRTVDSSHFETRFNKLDPIYNTTETCPYCNGEKYYFG
jgi:hypothetical protein